MVTIQDINKLRKQTFAGLKDCKEALIQAQGDFQRAIDFLRKKGQIVAQNRMARLATEGRVFAEANAAQDCGVILALSCETDYVAQNDMFRDLGGKLLQVALKHLPETAQALHRLVDQGQSVQERLQEHIGRIGEKIELAAYFVLKSPLVIPYVHTGNRLGVLVGLSQPSSSRNLEVGRDVAMQIAAMNPIAIDQTDLDANLLAKEQALALEQAQKEGKASHLTEKIAQGKLRKFFREHLLMEQVFVKDDRTTVAAHLQNTAPDLTIQSFKRVAISH